MKRNFHLCMARTALICALAGSGLTAGVAAKESAPPKLNVSDRPIDRTARGVSYAAVIKKAAPSVVNIYSTRTIHVQQFWHPFFDDPMFRQFFGPDYNRRGQRPHNQKSESLGSGVIVSEDGYILTNNHVVEGADQDGVQVALAGGEEKHTARVVANDPQTDLAVLKIEARKLPAITIADSDKLEVGDVVLAIGNPFGVGQSVTMGIVSAMGRGLGILGDTGYEDFIQTDAAINPGNSGGALVDTEGRLIGINQSIVSGSGANAGVGFAVPSNLARSIMDRLVTEGKVERGYLGVGIQPVTPELAKAFQLRDDSGALVSEVRPDTPAAIAGLKDGDLIIAFNDKKVMDSRHFRLMVAQTRPKTKVTLQIIRDGREKTVTATLAELPDELASGPHDEKVEQNAGNMDSLDGVEVTDLDSRVRRENNIPASIKGALVTNVDPDSAAADAGLRAGEVIQEIDRQPVQNADEAVELSKKVKGDHVLLRVWSNAGGSAGSHYLPVEVRQKK